MSVKINLSLHSNPGEELGSWVWGQQKRMRLSRWFHFLVQNSQRVKNEISPQYVPKKSQCTIHEQKNIEPDRYSFKATPMDKSNHHAVCLIRNPFSAHVAMTHQGHSHNHTGYAGEAAFKTKKWQASVPLQVNTTLCTAAHKSWPNRHTHTHVRRDFLKLLFCILSQLNRWSSLAKEWVNNVDKGALHVIYYEDLTRNTRQVLEELANFLGKITWHINLDYAVQ